MGAIWRACIYSDTSFRDVIRAWLVDIWAAITSPQVVAAGDMLMNPSQTTLHGKARKYEH